MKHLLFLLWLLLSFSCYSQCPEVSVDNNFCEMIITIEPGGPGDYYYRINNDFPNPGIQNVQFLGQEGTYSLTEEYGWLCWWQDQSITIGYWDPEAEPDPDNWDYQISWCETYDGPGCNVIQEAELIIQETSECNVYNLSVNVETSGGDSNCHNAPGNFNFEYDVFSFGSYEWLDNNTIRFNNENDGTINFSISAYDENNDISAYSGNQSEPNCPCEGELATATISELECGVIQVIIEEDPVAMSNCFSSNVSLDDFSSWDGFNYGNYSWDDITDNTFQLYNGYLNHYNPNLDYDSNVSYYIEYWDIDYVLYSNSYSLENCPCNDEQGSVIVDPQEECNILKLEFYGSTCQELSYYFNAEYMVQGRFNDFDPSVTGIELLSNKIRVDPWHYDFECQGCNNIDPNFDYASDTYDITFQALNYLPEEAGGYEVLGEVTYTISRCPCGDPNALNYSGTESIFIYDCEYMFCNDDTACQFDINLVDPDNTTCTYPGCIDPDALNYDATAGCDDGSCIYEPLPGDANGDFVVDILDLNLVSSNFGCPENCSGDANGDGAVNILDFLMVSTNWTN